MNLAVYYGKSINCRNPTIVETFSTTEIAGAYCYIVGAKERDLNSDTWHIIYVVTCV